VGFGRCMGGEEVVRRWSGGGQEVVRRMGEEGKKGELGG